MKTTLLLLVLVLASACATRQKLMDANAVTMTREPLAPGQNLVEVGPVDSEFCANSFSDSGDVGLMDEAIKAAQTKTGADWITGVTFWTHGSCVAVTGTGMKVQGGAEATPKKAKK